MPLFTPTKTAVRLAVRVTPRAGRTVLAGIQDETLLVKLAAAPVDDAANQALVELLAASFEVPRRSVAIVAGHKSRTKRVEFFGVSAATLEQRLAVLLER